MIDQEQTDKLSESLTLSKSTLVIFPATLDLDLFLASYCLYVFSKNLASVTALVTETRLLCPKFSLKLPPELTTFIKSEQIETEMGKENLVISFPYQEKQVDNVSYYIGEHDQRFYLTIKPKHGVAPLDSEAVEFTYAGSQADLLVLCGVTDLEDLEQLYFAYENLYKGADNLVINFNDNDLAPANSYCQAFFHLFRDLVKNTDAPESIDWADIPTLLLYGIELKNDGLQSPQTQAETFLAVGELLQLGARRLFQVNAKRRVHLVKPPQ